MDKQTAISSSNGESSSESSMWQKKRKLADAFHNLDVAVQGPDRDRPPAKKTRLPRSLYTTLAKYGVKNKDTKANGVEPVLLRNSTAPELGETANKTPHLTAILSRAATRTKNAFTFKLTPSSPPSPLPASAEYTPSSLQSFMARLETFKLSTYANKPPSLDPVAASVCGWTNDGKDRLLTFCAANSLVEKQRQGLIDNHKNGCPWRTRQCDPSIYCIPLKSPTATVKDVKSNALILDPLMEGVVIKHPLTPNQLSSLRKVVASYTLPIAHKPTDSPKPTPAPDAMDVDEDINGNADANSNSKNSPEDSENKQLKEPSEAAVVASLFGWTLVPPSANPAPSKPAKSLRDDKISALRRTAATPLKSALSSFSTPSKSISRPSTPSRSASSALTPRPTFSRPSTPGPSLSRRSSISLSASRQGSPMSEAKRPASAATNGLPFPLFRIPSSLLNKRDNALLQCNLCQRRIGLWAFLSNRDANEGTENGTGAAQKAEAPVTTNNGASAQLLSASAVVQRPKRPMPQRQFDLLKEHRSYCPYVVKSTTVPSLSSYDPNANGLSTSSLPQPNTALEGWRAVLTVLLRYRMAQRQRQADLDVFGAVAQPGSTNGEGDGAQNGGELDNVKVMAAGVKERGGRDLLKYVKRLLG
ncbi:hypothetical protein FA15DRAFT_678579 [Coprinopsis marcescibilis]|uniref:Zf-C3HC-domain-containing protein n=1 Tax=Coprinopsis marcescibilis TaxID=230819 RepID=A0A5C3L625_COPMA|nr:hypothetical protein FA15DRAFT_678579 [Coprinopsis marcescibilis]